jgi:hypothetical protein
MRLDPLLKSDRAVLVFEAIGDDKVRVGRELGQFEGDSAR